MTYEEKVIDVYNEAISNKLRELLSNELHIKSRAVNYIISECFLAAKHAIDKSSIKRGKKK